MNIDSWTLDADGTIGCRGIDITLVPTVDDASDITQIDLPRGAKSGLKDCVKILKNIEGIGHCTFDAKDVVRHKLVQDIIKAYAKYESKAKS